MTAVMLSPGIWAFLAGPVLDVRFSRRWYLIATAAAAAALPVLALLNLDHLGLVEVFLVAGYFFANLYQSALGAWLSTIFSAEEENGLSAWVSPAGAR
jgi:PAT family beta-lactamase induction signal transducer AmpG